MSACVSELLTILARDTTSRPRDSTNAQHSEKWRSSLILLFLTLTPTPQLILALLPPAYISDAATSLYFHCSTISLHYPSLRVYSRHPRSIPVLCNALSTQQNLRFCDSSSLSALWPSQGASPHKVFVLAVCPQLEMLLSLHCATFSPFQL